MKTLPISLAALLFAGTVLAQAARPEVEAEVRQVDPGAQKITLRHGDIPNLGMGAMTMVFRARDPALLEQVKPGDRVRFTAERVDGTLTVMSMAPAAGR